MALTTRIGYEETLAIAKQAVDENRTIRVVATESTGLRDEELDAILDLWKMMEPSVY